MLDKIFLFLRGRNGARADFGETMRAMWAVAWKAAKKVK